MAGTLFSQTGLQLTAGSGRLDWGMSNVLKVNHQEAIRSLHEQGWSQRRIARELRLHRRTVGRYIDAAKCTSNPITGSGDEAHPKCTTNPITGSEGAIPSKCTTNSTAGSDSGPPGTLACQSGPKSLCEAFAAAIGTKVEAGLSAQRIYQDLVGESTFKGSYQSVRRFVARLKASEPRRVWRMECEPGEEMQVDFGLGAPIYDTEGKRPRRSWVFRAVLSYSRKGYSVRWFGRTPRRSCAAWKTVSEIWAVRRCC